jgi:hypothetical protein
MDDDSKEMVTSLILALTRCPQNATECLGQLLQILLVMIRPHPDHLLNIRHRISNGKIENWDGDSQPQVIKFTSCLPMVGGSLSGRHDIAEILLKVALKH